MEKTIQEWFIIRIPINGVICKMPTTTFEHKYNIGDIVWTFEPGLRYSGPIQVKVISINLENFKNVSILSYCCRALSSNKEVNCFESQMFIEKEKCEKEGCKNNLQ